MLFNSFPFIFIFFPITLFIYYQFGKSKSSFLQLLALSVASFIFYAYWKKSYLILLLGSVCINFAFGEYLMQDKNKMIFVLGLIFNVAVLFYFKYTSFFIQNIAYVSGLHLSFHHIVLPLGISFITFQKITYLTDVYRGKVTDSNFLNYLVFISFFPQLIAGPIVHYQEIMPQFSAKSKRFSYRQFNIGLSFFIIGLAKKVILADSAAYYADPLFVAVEQGSSVTFEEAWVSVLAYSLQIYFDFSGYSDMAIGLARTFGIRLPFNFNSPYKAFNMIEFWRRWHMTLSRFLRDYIYIPLGGNRNGIIRKYANLMLTMLIGGLWHGANWTFVCWGGLHGFYLVINHLWHSFCGHFGLKRLTQSFIYRTLAIFVTFFFVTLAWVFFRAKSMQSAGCILQSLFGLNGFAPANLSYLNELMLVKEVLAIFSLPESTFLTTIVTSVYITLMLILVWCLPNSQTLMRSIRRDKNLFLRCLIFKPTIMHFASTIFLFQLCLIFISNFAVKPFEYFAF